LVTALAALAAAPADYALVAADVTPLNTKLNTLSAALDAADAAKVAASTAVAAKDVALDDLVSDFRELVAQVQVNPAVSDASRAAAGLPIRDTVRTISTPITPNGLTASADASGVNHLSWNSNGNSVGVQYVVEAKVSTAAEFTIVDVVTATTFHHGGRTAGVPVLYRVRARRGSQTSEPSNVAGVYQT
jgi:hypothetical protein